MDVSCSSIFVLKGIAYDVVHTRPVSLFVCLFVVCLLLGLFVLAKLWLRWSSLNVFEEKRFCLSLSHDCSKSK